MSVDKNEFEDNESKFNKSIDDLRRISELERQANMFRCMNNWDTHMLWMNTLAAIDAEISCYLEKTDEEELNKLRIYELKPMRYRKLLGNIPPSSVTKKLDEWDRKLRVLIQKKGMGIVAKDKDRSFILPDG